MFSDAPCLAAPDWQLLPAGGQSKPKTKVEILTDRVTALVNVEAASTGDLEVAMKSVARRTGIGFWTLANIKRGRAKKCDATVFDRVKDAYLELCQRQLAALQHEITLIHEANPDAALDDLVDEATRLAARLADARSHSLAARTRVGIHQRLAAHRGSQRLHLKGTDQ